MPLNGTSPQFGPEDDGTLPSNPDRTAGVVTLVGCVATLLAVVLPSADKVIFAVSPTPLPTQGGGLLLAVLTAISAGIASALLLRRPAKSGLAMILIGLALAQVGVATWDCLTILHAIGQADSRLVLIGAIGTGAYLGVIGSVITLAGGILAWTKRRREFVR